MSGRSVQEALVGKSLAGARFEISLQSASGDFIRHCHIRAKDGGQILACGDDITSRMSRKPATEIIRRTDVDVAVAEFKKINVPQAATLSLRS
jgi:hypothetical protein